MCGITGIVSFNEKGKRAVPKVSAAVKALRKRPDGEGVYFHENTALGHRRLAVIDTSGAGAQPFTDPSGRYTIIFNGEFFNYKDYREELQRKDVHLKSHSDTEVLLWLFIQYGPACLEKINGFFSFAVYDKQTLELFLARDRYGIKPLFFYQDENIFAFASEMKALFAYDIPRVLDEVSLFTYLQLNYIPSPGSILKSVSKLEPGHYLTLSRSQTKSSCYYKIPYREQMNAVPGYESAQKTLSALLEESVRKRLISDVPLGCFLSGGMDSSIITCLASKYIKHLKTFSIGYRDEPLLDETPFAQKVSRQFQTDHTVFLLSNEDIFENLSGILDDMDEPFADSSALAVHILSRNTRKYVKVTLSGDGADELFGGYNKHAAEYSIRRMGSFAPWMALSRPLWNALPKSRDSFLGNRIRQMKQLSIGAGLSDKERYWLWAGHSDEASAHQLLNIKSGSGLYKTRKEDILRNINADFNSVLLTDMDLVLKNDMLVKVDSMSMANSLEVRVPFLDVNVVDFAFSIPSDYKVSFKGRKLILKETFRSRLPPEILERAKHGFEVPLLKWFRTDLKGMITENLFTEAFIADQGLFHYGAIRRLLEQLFSANPDDSAARIWALVAFQYWWKKYMY